MNKTCKWAALTLALCLPFSAQAHRAWMLPSATVLSGEEPWITVDAAVSNDLFYFEHFPMRIAGVGAVDQTPAGGPPGMRPRPAAQLQIQAPDGSLLQPQNGHIGRYRSSFDLPLSQKGTYKLSIANHGLFASYKENGQQRRWMGSADALAKEIPAAAEDLQVSQTSSRMEVFVTSGKTTDTVLATTGKGLELQPVTHPNDLFAGETAEFILLLDGKPAADVAVSVIPGGNRYRDQLGEIELKSDAQGRISITWPEAGMYWLEAELESDQAQAPATRRRASYSATLEVLAP
ncbi:DUF4198 domain-containing protein [Pseudomonas sp. NY15364]|uniref:DUF4198 domain-containing protein n=1 Tax=Pseudomonas sp. NY15364 TaxID=3400353 RepID=UPI003A885A50